MQIRLKLMGTLQAKTPEGGALEVPEGATVQDVLESLDVAAGQVQVVTINGTPKRDFAIQLQPDDELVVLAPVGGG